MHCHKLDIIETGKYLGILLDKKLSWKPHVDAICKKANQTRDFIRRNLKDCQREGCEISMLQNICAPNCRSRFRGLGSVGEGNQHLRYQIEMAQRYAPRFVSGDWRTTSSVTALI